MHRTLRRVFQADAFEALARRRLPRAVFDFYAGGAGDEHSLRANRAAFEALAFAPRVLVDVHAPSAQVPLLGRDVALPLVIAPMGAVGFGRRDGDLALARAAAAAGIPSVLSTVATASIEEVAAAAPGGQRWFQLYPLRQMAPMLRLLDRAAAAGCEVLVLTVDVPVGGKRLRDLRNDFTMPFRFTPRNLLDFAAHPRWALDMALRGVPPMKNLAEGTLDAPRGAQGAVASSVGQGFDAGFDWRGLAQLRARWPGKLLLKGVLRPDDALRAQRAGCDGLVLSNHGGRQLDGATTALAALPAVRAAVGPGMDLLVDGGIRNGSDIAKALALGAQAVMVGRPALFAACVAGEAGVARLIALLHEELRQTLQLCGVPHARDLDPGALAGVAAAPPEAPRPLAAAAAGALHLRAGTAGRLSA